jgi:hypothetical protein
MNYCRKCHQLFEPHGKGEAAYYCRPCAVERGAYYRAQRREREAAGDDAVWQLHAAGFVFDADPRAVEYWRGWTAPLDRATHMMFAEGDFPPGLIVYTTSGERTGPPCVVVPDPYGGQVVKPLTEYKYGF